MSDVPSVSFQVVGVGSTDDDLDGRQPAILPSCHPASLRPSACPARPHLARFTALRTLNISIGTHDDSQDDHSDRNEWKR